MTKEPGYFKLPMEQQQQTGIQTMILWIALAS